MSRKLVAYFSASGVTAKVAEALYDARNRICGVFWLDGDCPCPAFFLFILGTFSAKIQLFSLKPTLLWTFTAIVHNSPVTVHNRKFGAIIGG